MRGTNREQSGRFSYIIDRAPGTERSSVAAAASDSRWRAERVVYAKSGRPSITPQKLLPALLLQVRPTVSSEQQLMEQLDYNLLYRSLVGLSIGDLVWDVTVSTENRERLLASDVANRVFHQVVAVARAQGLLSVEHLTVDGTLIEAWAGQKSTKQPPLDVRGNPSVDFRGERCANATPQSTTDPRARPYKKAGQEAKFYHKGHLLRIATAC